MDVETQVQRAANRNRVLEPQFTAHAGVSNHAGRVPMAGQMVGNVANRETDERDSSIYDFNTYAEGEEGVRLLIQNGFDGRDFWLLGKGRQGERHPLTSHGKGERIKWQDRHGPSWVGVSAFVFESARDTGPHLLGPHLLIMHGNSAEASKAHSVLVEHSSCLIEEGLRFR